MYLIPDDSSFFTDPTLFDVAFIDSHTMEALTGQWGIINEIAFRIKPGVAYEEIENKVKEILEPYGLLGLTDAENQLSNFLLNQEIEGVRMMAKSLPGLFILIAVFILYIMLRRMVEQQRIQIGTMKAFGLSSLNILSHYGFYGGTIGFLGGILGICTGFFLSGAMTRIFGQYFNLPNLVNQHSWQYSIQGIALAVIPCIVAALVGSVSILKLVPAQAMQPPAPKVIKKLFLERISFIWQSLGMLSRMAIRNIFRSLGRSFFIITGTMFSFSLLWIVFSFNLMIDLMIFNEINEAQKYDLKVSLTQVQDFNEVKNALESLEGVSVVEPIMEMGVKLRYGSRQEETRITGLPSKAQLYEVLDKGKDRIAISQEGILLSKQLADKLSVQVGKPIYVEAPFLKDSVQVYVSGIVEQYFGMGNYMNLKSLSQILQTKEAATSSLVKVSGGPGILQSVEEKLLLADGVAAVENKEAIFNMYQRMLEPTSASIYGMVIVGVITAFAVIYASATVALSERQREISSAKVLGMTDQEIILTLMMENGLLTLLGVLCGMPLAKGMMLGMQQAYATDLYSLPTQLDVNGFIYSVIALGLSLCLALWALRNKISNLEIVEVLKSRD